ncbi:hypothetical protein BU17DRAFT_87762 [Hysterangium stoloniferum]|nr:hypothetical protein BU17DRAFT_87762 [Hysterangium stoloniferum]
MIVLKFWPFGNNLNMMTLFANFKPLLATRFASVLIRGIDTDTETSALARMSGYYGTPYSSCDSSLRFENLTLDWLEREWAGEVDFVIWTEDSVRYDDDNLNPPTLTEIYAMNTYVAARMEQSFTKRGIPVVPLLGVHVSHLPFFCPI